MEQRYLIDTNVIIDVQMGRIPKNGMDFMERIMNKEFNVSFVSYIEFKGYKDITPQSDVFISLATVVGINNVIIDICIDLRKSKRISLPDSIIAATALSQNMTIITHNVKDFESIDKLRVVDPYNLAK